MLARDREHRLQAELEKVSDPGIVNGRIHLVHGHEHRSFAAAQQVGDLALLGQQPRLTIHDPEDCVGDLDGGLCLGLDRQIDVAVGLGVEACRIHQQDPAGPHLDLLGDAVPSQSRRILDQDPPMTGKAVKERGLAHIGAPDDGDDGNRLRQAAQATPEGSPCNFWAAGNPGPGPSQPATEHRNSPALEELS